jgi:hypothetical protein
VSSANYLPEWRQKLSDELLQRLWRLMGVGPRQSWGNPLALGGPTDFAATWEQIWEQNSAKLAQISATERDQRDKRTPGELRFWD